MVFGGKYEEKAEKDYNNEQCQNKIKILGEGTNMSKCIEAMEEDDAGNMS